MRNEPYRTKTFGGRIAVVGACTPNMCNQTKNGRALPDGVLYLTDVGVAIHENLEIRRKRSFGHVRWHLAFAQTFRHSQWLPSRVCWTALGWTKIPGGNKNEINGINGMWALGAGGGEKTSHVEGRSSTNRPATKIQEFAKKWDWPRSWLTL